MKKIILTAIVAVAASATLPAGQDNLLMKFSTVGPDTYADGKTTVADGEFYALVWVKKGAAFAGFNADGTVVDAANNALICAVPYAENGHCPETVLEMDRVLADSYAGSGSFELHILDTRGADGVPKGALSSGVNGFGSAATFSLTAGTAGDVKSVAAKQGALAATASSLPASIPQPKITSIKVENGMVKLTVQGTSKLLRYGVKSGDEPNDLAPLPVSDAIADGDDFGEIEIDVPVEKGGHFVSIGRAGLK